MAKRPQVNEQRTNDSRSALAIESDPSQPFLHRWNDLVSVTNWEKGRIICEWRAALEAEGATVNESSDEVWAARVGNVTSQHVGRLRRVWERFGAVHAEYPPLYWSHFQVAIDWDDAEMWLEGAVQNDWSVSQMRAKRWETLGAPDSLKPCDEDIFTGDMDDDASADGAAIDDASADGAAAKGGAIRPETATVRDVREAAETDEARDGEYGGSQSSAGRGIAGGGASDGEESAAKRAAAPRARPFENLPALPDDVSEAFEQFKLAILTHKLAGWSEITCDDMLACLDALRELALQPAGE